MKFYRRIPHQVEAIKWSGFDVDTKEMTDRLTAMKYSVHVGRDNYGRYFTVMMGDNDLGTLNIGDYLVFWGERVSLYPQKEFLNCFENVDGPKPVVDRIKGRAIVWLKEKLENE